MPFRNPKGLSWFVTALFLVDDMAGGGLVALPTAMVQTEFYSGFALLIVMMSVTLYTAWALGNSWNILLNTWPEYRVHCRKPYPEIAFRAMGEHARRFVSIVNDITQFGISTVYLLLSSKNIHDVVKTYAHTDFSYCFVVLILAVCLLPVTLLKSPQDFWWAVVAAMFTTAAAVVLIVVGISLDFGLCSQYTEVPPLKMKSFFLAVGTLIFSCGGHAAFPTIQHDMRNPGEYGKSLVVSFLMLFLMYGAIATTGYFTYHDAIRDSILPSIQTQWIQQTCNILITIHCILTVTIVLNPLNQELEDVFHCPHHFCWQRVAVRSATMTAVVFVGESIPNFGPLLDLVGGSSMTLAAVILPCLFYVYLLAGHVQAKETGKDHTQVTFTEVLIHTPRATLFICVFIIFIGFVGGAAATFSAIVELSTTRFLLPCYVTPFLSKKHPADNAASVYCCGPYQNITHSGVPDMCAPMPAVPFYG